MKISKHIETWYKCNNCEREINPSKAWYRIRYNDDQDFCSEICAKAYRDRIFTIVYSSFDRREIIGNTD